MSGKGITPANEEYLHFANTKTFGSLDGLRAIAILAVVWHHTSNVPGWQITTRGFLGVDLFFTISGFLIVTLLLREQRRTGTISLRNFYIRRFLRIFPLYYLVLLVVGLVAFLLPGNTSKALKGDLLYAIFYVSDLVPMHSLLSITWSLSVEEQFYIVVPTVTRYARQLVPFLLPFAYVIVCLPPFGVFPKLHLPEFFRQTTFGPILLGAMIAHVLNAPSGFSCVWNLVKWRFAPLMALGLVFAAASYPAGDISGWPRLAVHWAMLVLVTSCVVREANILSPLLSLWPIRRIGIVSYGIYLYHLLVAHFVVKALGVAGLTQGFTTFICAALGSWALAELSYRLFEIRFLALKPRYESHTGVNVAA
jgi:peptidoglycan/LPS O-acetylase OafA/YrhL